MPTHFFSPLAACLLALPLAAFAAPFSNGSFEAPAGGPLRAQITAADMVSGWVHAGTGYDIYESSQSDGIDAQDGGYYISFGHNGTTAGTLAQTFDTVVGASYTVSYYVTSQQGVGAGQSLTVSALDALNNGALLAQANTTISDSKIEWVAGTPLTFIAKSTSTTLRFLDTTDVSSVGSGVANWGLDNVKVTSTVSTPASYTASAAGSLKARTLSVTIQSATAQAGQTTNLYLLAFIPSLQWYFFLTPSGWQQVTSIVAAPPYSSVTLGSHTIKVLDGSFDVTSLIGTQIYAGYGSSLTHMATSGTYGLAYTITE